MTFITHRIQDKQTVRPGLFTLSPLSFIVIRFKISVVMPTAYLFVCGESTPRFCMIIIGGLRSLSTPPLLVKVISRSKSDRGTGCLVKKCLGYCFFSDDEVDLKSYLIKFSQSVSVLSQCQIRVVLITLSLTSI